MLHALSFMRARGRVMAYTFVCTVTVEGRGTCACHIVPGASACHLGHESLPREVGSL